MPYTILIPIHNEESHIPALLNQIKPYTLKHEVILINDGSTDKTYKLLLDCPFIKLLNFKKNQGKGIALREGLKQTTHEKIIIIDGDLEIPLLSISRLMTLNQDIKVRCIFGSRYNKIDLFNSPWDLGNFLFTKLFNFLHNSDHKDVLCCAKAFYKKDINLKNLSAIGFDIDVEIASSLTKKLKIIHSVHLPYNRRNIKEGKKLRFWDAWSILKRILKNS